MKSGVHTHMRDATRRDGVSRRRRFDYDYACVPALNYKTNFRSGYIEVERRSRVHNNEAAGGCSAHRRALSSVPEDVPGH